MVNVQLDTEDEVRVFMIAMNDFATKYAMPEYGEEYNIEAGIALSIKQKAYEVQSI
jgi:hypothetical protein